MLRLPLKNKNKMNDLKIITIEKRIKSLIDTHETVGMEMRKKKIKSQQIENKIFGKINLTLSVIPINMNKIKFSNKRQRRCLFKNQLCILYKRHS